MSGPLMSVEITRPEGISDRNHRKWSNAALRAAATNHLLRFAPDHFLRNSKTGPGGAYEYEPRTKKHQLRKARQMGHQLPNVFTGRESAAVISRARVTATFQRSRIIYRPLHSRNSDQSERWVREMEVIAPEEAAVALQVAHDEYTKQLNEHLASKVERVRGADGRYI
jgi:hypothetical protein